MTPKKRKCETNDFAILHNELRKGEVVQTIIHPLYYERAIEVSFQTRKGKKFRLAFESEAEFDKLFTPITEEE